jgi:hypothetical protein
MMGPGKYNDICTVVRLATSAECVVVIVGNGNQGSGFAMQAQPTWNQNIVEVLRSVASQIEEDLMKN